MTGGINMNEIEECIAMLNMIKLASIERPFNKRDTIVIDVQQSSFEWVISQAIKLLKEVDINGKA